MLQGFSMKKSERSHLQITRDFDQKIGCGKWFGRAALRAMLEATASVGIAKSCRFDYNEPTPMRRRRCADNPERAGESVSPVGECTAMGLRGHGGRRVSRDVYPRDRVKRGMREHPIGVAPQAHCPLLGRGCLLFFLIYASVAVFPASAAGGKRRIN